MSVQDVYVGEPASESVKQRPEPSRVFELFGGVPAFPAVAAQLLHLTDDPEISQARVAETVGSDPGLATDVLMLANSPLFGFTSKIVTVQAAVCLLGTERIGRLAVSVVLRSCLRGLLQDPSVQRVWRHSLACSLIAAEIAPRVWIPKDRASTAGLLHDVGRIGMMSAYPNELCRLLDREHGSPQEALYAEKEEIGVNHCEAGWCLAKTWGFPDTLCEVSRHHHHAPDGTVNLLSLVAFACRMADALGFPAALCRNQEAPEQTLERFAAFQPVVLEADITDLRAKAEIAVRSVG